MKPHIKDRIPPVEGSMKHLICMLKCHMVA